MSSKLIYLNLMMMMKAMKTKVSLANLTQRQVESIFGKKLVKRNSREGFSSYSSNNHSRNIIIIVMLIN